MEKLPWEIIFGLAALGGIGGLWTLQKSAAREALHAARNAWAKEEAARRRQAEATEKELWEKADSERLLREQADVRANGLERQARDTENDRNEKVRELEYARKEQAAARDEIDIKAEQIRGLKNDLQKKERTITTLTPHHSNTENLARRLDEMKLVWLDTRSTEMSCQKILARNLWVLGPDYVVGRHRMYVKGTQAMTTIMGELFPNHAEDDSFAPISGLIRPDLCGWVEARGLGPSASQSEGLFNPPGPDEAPAPERVLLIIELKRPRVSLRWKMLEQAYTYAWYLLQNVQELQRHRIECLVIGGSRDGVNDAHIRWGKYPHDAIRIVPMSYRQLYDRARAMAKPYLDLQFGVGTVGPWDVAAMHPVPELEQAPKLVDQLAEWSAASPHEEEDDAGEDQANSVNSQMAPGGADPALALSNELPASAPCPPA